MANMNSPTLCSVSWIQEATVFVAKLALRHGEAFSDFRLTETIC